MPRRKKSLSVAVVGATGAVGSEMLRVLAERKLPIRHLVLLASSRSAGKRLRFNSRAYAVRRLTSAAFAGIDVALFSAGASRSKMFAPEAVKRGAIVVDNSSAFRMDPRVPLVVPEVNADVLRSHQGIIANPNCSTIILVMALKPLQEAAGLKQVVVTTFQSVSGAGARAVDQLVLESQAWLRRLRGRTGSRRSQLAMQQPHVRVPATARVLPGQIAGNILPQIDRFDDEDYTREEWKMIRETRKILRDPGLHITATCARVPVVIGHSESVNLTLRRALTPDDVRSVLRQAPGVRVVDEPGKEKYPQPIDVAGHDDVLVGRIRRDVSQANGIAMWVVGDNIRKGAATNAVHIAELLTS